MILNLCSWRAVHRSPLVLYPRSHTSPSSSVHHSEPSPIKPYHRLHHDPPPPELTRGHESTSSLLVWTYKGFTSSRLTSLAFPRNNFPTTSILAAQLLFFPLAIIILATYSLAPSSPTPLRCYAYSFSASPYLAQTLRSAKAKSAFLPLNLDKLRPGSQCWGIRRLG